MSETISARVVRGAAKDTMGIVVPDAVVERLSNGRRPAVLITVGGHQWRSTVSRMGGRFLVGIAKAHREPAGLAGTEELVEVTLALDTAPRTVEIPHDLARELEKTSLREGFERLPPSMQKEHVRQITSAKAEETRLRRILKAVDAAKARA